MCMEGRCGKQYKLEMNTAPNKMAILRVVFWTIDASHEKKT